MYNKPTGKAMALKKMRNLFAFRRHENARSWSAGCYMDNGQVFPPPSGSRSSSQTQAITSEQRCDNWLTWQSTESIQVPVSHGGAA